MLPKFWYARTVVTTRLSVLLGATLCLSSAAFAQKADTTPSPDKVKSTTTRPVKYGHEKPKPAPKGAKTLKIGDVDLGVPDRNSVSFLTRLSEAIKAQNKEKEEKRERELAEKSGGKAEEREDEKGKTLAVRPDAARAAMRKKSNIGTPEIETKEDERLDIIDSMLYYLKPRAFPNDTLDAAAFRRALVQRDRLPAANLSSSKGFSTSSVVRGAAVGSPGPKWEFAGPKNMTPPWPFGAGSQEAKMIGRVNSVAFDPTKEGVVYIASPSGGVWKSTDKGKNWTALGDKFPTLKTTALAVGPDGTVYVGMGDYAYPGSFGGSVYSKGIMRSRDGGATWQNIGANLMTGMSISAIVADPENPNIVMATTGRGDNLKSFVFRSTNGGDTFQRATISGTSAQGDWNDLKYSVPDATGKRYYYATCSNPNNSKTGALWRSADRGVTWKKLNAPLMTPFYLPYYQVTVAPSASDPYTVYLLEGDTLFGFGFIYKGVVNPADDSYSWTDISGNYDERFQNFGQAFYDMHLRAGVQGGKDVLYGGTLGFGGSVGANDTWVDISRTYDVETDAFGEWINVNDTFHTDQHCMAFDPFNPNGAIVGSDGGVYYMEFDPAKYNPATPAENYKAWKITSLNANLGITEFYYGDFHPTDPNIMLGGAQDNSTPNSTGDLNNWTNVGVGDGGGSAIVKTNTGYAQFSTNQSYSFVLRTGDNWQTRWFNGAPWDTLLNGMPGEYITPNWFFDYRPFVGPLFSDDNTGSIYLLTDYLWRWDEAQHKWEGHVGNAYLSPYYYCTAFAVAPSDSNRLYVGTGEGFLWMSKDRGKTWVQIASNELPYRTITSLSVHPTNPDDLIVTYSGTGSSHVFRCKTMSRPPTKFVKIDGFDATKLPDIPTNAVARDLSDPDNGIFVGTDIGVFYSADGGKNWGNATAPLGLPNVRINGLKTVPGTGYLNAVTYGRGMWRLALDMPPVVPINDPVKLSVTVSKPTIVNGQLNAIVSVYNNGTVTASGIQFKDIQVTFGANSVKGSPIPLNIGSIPGKSGGRPAYINRTFSFPTSVAGSGDVVTVTFKGSYFQAGPHDFTLTATLALP